MYNLIWTVRVMSGGP